MASLSLDANNIFELLDASPIIDVPLAEYRRLLGFPPDHEPTGRSAELMNWAIQWYQDHGKPWVYGRMVKTIKLNGSSQVELEGEVFNSTRLSSMLKTAEADQVLVVAVSAGKECETHAGRCWDEGKPDEYFFLEMYGSAVVENLIRNTTAKYCARADKMGKVVLPHYSPGYPEWDVKDQIKLMKVIANGNTGQIPGPLQVMSSGMLNPKKSLLAAVGITGQVQKTQSISSMVPCEYCSLEGCQYRRVPFAGAKNSGEVTNGIATGVTRINEPVSPDTITVTPSLNYSFSEKVLKKWSDERLTLMELENGGIEARFKFEGTTCSNMGMPLRFEYKIALDPHGNVLHIKNAHCGPAIEDNGYKSMCEYIARPNQLMNEIADELPLVGKSINEVLTWDRTSSPSGCYCAKPSRMHKWGMVLEVIHYALYNTD